MAVADGVDGPPVPGAGAGEGAGEGEQGGTAKKFFFSKFPIDSRSHFIYHNENFILPNPVFRETAPYETRKTLKESRTDEKRKTCRKEV
ncbi:MAG TPA: hypothetical protein ENJ37_05685 [Deltaproteobacteria bacterium]|nr:hypothetical protein [Deltaproteobacteria bacterium]